MHASVSSGLLSLCTVANKDIRCRVQRSGLVTFVPPFEKAEDTRQSSDYYILPKSQQNVPSVNSSSSRRDIDTELVKDQ